MQSLTKKGCCMLTLICLTLVIIWNYTLTTEQIQKLTFKRLAFNSNSRGHVWTHERIDDATNKIHSDRYKIVRVSKPLIVFWTTWFSSPQWPITDPANCYNGKFICRISNDRKQYEEADAVFFHGPMPLHTLASTFPYLHKTPKHQLWVYHNLENPKTTKLGTHFWYVRDHVFNVINSYTLDSHASGSYGVINHGNFSNEDNQNINHARGKTKLIAWMSSNCHPGRTNFVRQLSQHLNISMYGNCGTLECPHDGQCWNRIAHEHKFYLSFENYICKDYVTEKFYYNALQFNMIPIVVGGANYSNNRVAPPGSYINLFDFRNVTELAAYIHKVAKNDTLYNSYFEWQSSFRVKRTGTPAAICSVCRKLYDYNWVQETSKQTIADLSKVWGDVSKYCMDYPQSMSDFRVKFPWL